MIRKLTTVQLTTNDARQLKMVSVLSGVPQTQIISEFIEEIFRKFRPLTFKSVATGERISFDFQVTAKPEVDLVLAQFPCAMDAPREETDPKMMEMLEAGFNRLDRAKEERKKVFAKALNDLFPISEADKQAQEVISEQITLKVKQPLTWKEEQKI